MWTPSVQSDDYWFRLQYDPETARFEDISALLLKPSSSESLNSCQICEHFSQQNAKSVPLIADNGFTLNGEHYQVTFIKFIKIVFIQVPFRLGNVLLELNQE